MIEFLAQMQSWGDVFEVLLNERDHREWLSVRCATLNPDYRNESKKLSYARLGSSCQNF
jgi:hypothetical protein